MPERDGQIKTVRDMCIAPLREEVLQVLPGFSSQRKGDNSCNRLNCIVSAHVALTASCIYAFCPFAARYFSASEKEACVARRLSEDSVPHVSHLNVSIWL